MLIKCSLPPRRCTHVFLSATAANIAFCHCACLRTGSLILRHAGCCRAGPMPKLFSPQGAENPKQRELAMRHAGRMQNHNSAYGRSTIRLSCFSMYQRATLRQQRARSVKRWTSPQSALPALPLQLPLLLPPPLPLPLLPLRALPHQLQPPSWHHPAGPAASPPQLAAPWRWRPRRHQEAAASRSRLPGWLLR